MSDCFYVKLYKNRKNSKNTVCLSYKKYEGLLKEVSLLRDGQK